MSRRESASLGRGAQAGVGWTAMLVGQHVLPMRNTHTCMISAEALTGRTCPAARAGRRGCSPAPAEGGPVCMGSLHGELAWGAT